MQVMNLEDNITVTFLNNVIKLTNGEKTFFIINSAGFEIHTSFYLYCPQKDISTFNHSPLQVFLENIDGTLDDQNKAFIELFNCLCNAKYPYMHYIKKLVSKNQNKKHIQLISGYAFYFEKIYSKSMVDEIIYESQLLSELI